MIRRVIEISYIFNKYYLFEYRVALYLYTCMHIQCILYTHTGKYRWVIKFLELKKTTYISIWTVQATRILIRSLIKIMWSSN